MLSIQSWSPRDFAHDRHRTVDDRPYGGGTGDVNDGATFTGCHSCSKSRGR
ncbi:MAG: hypothetical protein ACLR17_20640 [Enterobacteriaceae bacterium]